MLIENRYICGVCGFTDLGTGDTAHSCTERLNPNKGGLIDEITTIRTQNTELQRQLEEQRFAFTAKLAYEEALMKSKDYFIEKLYDYAILDESNLVGITNMANAALNIKSGGNVLQIVAYAYVNYDGECEQIEWTDGESKDYPDFMPLYRIKDK